MIIICVLFAFMTLCFSTIFVSFCLVKRLYNNCQWDDKAIRKLVGDGKLAARSKGAEVETKDINQECPICFLYYAETNVTKCCSANLCTECYLQVRPQKEKHSTCPFCNSTKLAVSVANKLSDSQIQERQKEEQRAIEATIRSRSNSTSEKYKENHNSDAESGFGTSLAQDSRVALMRARSESFASSGSGGDHNIRDDDRLIKSLAMTPEERRRLEEEMKAQLSHPAFLRVEAEAQERRLENDRAYSNSHPGSLRAQRAAELFRSNSRYRGRRGGRDWNQIVDAFERGGNGEIHSLDDLVVLEAAILLSQDEESRQARNEDGDLFDAASHARDGFPLVQSFFVNRHSEGGGSAAARRRLLNSSGEGGSSMALDTAALLMRGISEEDQVAMAIAASMQEQQPNDDDDGNEEDDHGSNDDRSVHTSDDDDEPSEAYDDVGMGNERDSSDENDDFSRDSRDLSEIEYEEENTADEILDDASVSDNVDDESVSSNSQSVSSNRAEEVSDDEGGNQSTSVVEES